MNDVDIIRLTPCVDLQWWVYWVTLPEPIGRHPALIISSDIYNDGSSVIVARIGTKPPRGKNYETLWVPVIIDEGGQLSYIKLDSIHRVDKKDLDRRIGKIPVKYRQEVIDRYFALLTGDQPNRMVDVDVKPHDVGMDGNRKPTSVEDDVVWGVDDLVGMLTDVTLDVRKQRDDIANRAYLRVSSIPKEELPLYFVAMVREYGYDGITEYNTTRRRFDNILESMILRSMCDIGIIDDIKPVLKEKFMYPAKSGCER